MPDHAAAVSSPPRRASSSRKTRVAALIVACALFMQNLDSTVISTALPTMAKAFGADPVHMNVALTAYLLSLAVFIPTSGWMADRFGARTVFCSAIVVFTLGSILCGASDSLADADRRAVVQGFGGAMMVPVGRLVLLRSVAEKRTGRRDGVARDAGADRPGRRAAARRFHHHLFLIGDGSSTSTSRSGSSAPFSSRFSSRTSASLLRLNLDFRGLLFSGVGLASVMFGLETAGRGVVPPVLTVGDAHRRCPRGALDIPARPPASRAAARSWTAAHSDVRGLGARGLDVPHRGRAVPFLLPLMLQIGFGMTAVQSGMITFASSAGASS